MKKRILSILLLTVLILSLFTACGKSGAITAEEAQKAAFADAGVSASEATDVHVHVMDKDGIPCYSIHFSAGGNAYSVLISAADGSVVGYGH